MKLLHVTATHLNPVGGIPVVLRDLVEAQNRIIGFEARVLSIRAGILQINSKYFDVLEKKTFKEYLELYKPDLVIFHSHYYFEYLALYKDLVKNNIPYYIEPHGSFGYEALKKSKVKKEIANRLIFKTFMEQAKGYIFLNDEEKAKSRFRTKFDLVIPNGIDPKKIVMNIIPKKEWFFYYIGRFDITHKGLDFLFEALSNLDKKKKNIKLKLYGTGSVNEINYVNSRIKRFNFVKIVNCGPVYGELQNEVLEQSGIMILTSRYEGFPMTVLEGWKYGNPCIVTPGTNVSREAFDNKLGWRVELDPVSIGEIMLKASQEYSQHSKEYIVRCKNYVQDRYSWERIAELSYQSLKK